MKKAAVPPFSGRFRRGVSGNPKGRPRAKQATASESAFAIVIDRRLTLSSGGIQREVTLEEALQHKTYRDAVAGNRAARREVLKMIMKRETARIEKGMSQRPSGVSMRFEFDPDNADEALLLLGIACRDPRWTEPDGNRIRLRLEPWAVQAALSRRRGGVRLTEKEIAEIKRCTHNAAMLRWPRGSAE